MIPEGWREAKIREVAKIDVGRDLVEERFSRRISDTHRFPIYSNTVEQHGHYGFYDFPEYSAESITVVGRGIGLGTAFARKTPFGAIGRLLVLSPKCDSFDVGYLADYLNHGFEIHYESGGIPQLPGKTLGNYSILLPPLPEQRRIAEILATWDRAIETVEALIANARAQKKALMQSLLTGKHRLPGFSEQGRVVSLSDVARIETGGSNREDSLDVGEFTFFDRSTDVRRSDRYLFDAEAIIIGGEGQEFIPKYFAGKFDLHQRAYALHSFVNAYGRYVFYAVHHSRHLLLRYAVGSTVASLRMPTFQKVKIWLPSVDEQVAIAEHLTLADRGLDGLAIQLTALRQEKSALMQQLLTGKRRVKITEREAA